jgi:predicted metalloprotease with PDZ domain
MPIRRSLILVLTALFLKLAPANLLADGPTLQIEVDARELARRLVHAEIRIPCQPGPLKLWYPKWIPGCHGADGPLQNVGGFRVETTDGKPLRWKRDEVELFCVHCDVPAGVNEVRVRLDYICNEAAVLAAGYLSYGNSSVGVLNWNTCLVYPEGPTAEQIRVELRLRLPALWRYATALKSAGAPTSDPVTFQPVSLEQLIDSPLIAGEHLRTIALDTTPKAFLHVASESPGALRLDKKVIDLYTRVVNEAHALFGAAHYPEFHFLITCSDDLGYFGLEHLTSSLNGVRERDLLDDNKRKGWVANLIPHEYVHSWCGKYRRPAAMCTPNFHTPQKTRLLWVYEGLTEYLGEVLMVRSGLIANPEYREMLAAQFGSLMRRQGRNWRPLEDTAVASPILRAASANWNDLRRSQDYYPEGALVWLEADAIVRDRSQGKHSLDDFCKKFLGENGSEARVAPHNGAQDNAAPQNGAQDNVAPHNGAQYNVVPYDLPEIVHDLKQLADYDWDTFFARHVTATQQDLPLEVVGLCGYRLRYATKSPAYLDYLQQRAGGDLLSARDSLGLTFHSDGRIADVAPGMPGDKAGLAPGMRVLGVNGKKFSRERLDDGLSDTVARRKIEFLLLDGEQFRTLSVEYADGLRYLELMRNPDRPDALGEILKPVASHPAK